MTDATKTTTTQPQVASPSTSTPADPAAVSASPTKTSSDAKPSSTTNETASKDGDSFVKAGAVEPVVAKAAKPEWLPDDLWDAEKGAKTDDLKAALEDAKALRESKAKLPKSADDYKPDLPADFKLPENVKIDVNDPRFKEAQAVAHARGLSQEAFSEVLAIEVKRAVAQHEMLTAAVKARDEALGPNAAARIDALHSQIDAVAASPKEAADAKRMLVTPENVSLMERMFLALGSQGVATLTRAGKDGEAKGKIPGYEKMTMQQKLAAAGHV